MSAPRRPGPARWERNWLSLGSAKRSQLLPGVRICILCWEGGEVTVWFLSKAIRLEVSVGQFGSGVLEDSWTADELQSTSESPRNFDLMAYLYKYLCVHRGMYIESSASVPDLRMLGYGGHNHFEFFTIVHTAINCNNIWVLL
ncbi:hypothetical protein H671_2g4830 [Cricetulus griseus]|nr:hypothetical protein H671_2g4830 [Cricetulus griseus]